MSVTNLSAYKFAPLTALPDLRDRLRDFTAARGLKGTILLSTEGINLFVAGSATTTAELMAELRRVPGLEDLTPKESHSDHPPFQRMFVKIKREIIAFGVPGVDPAREPAPRLAPETLKQWLDEGRPVTLIDTRNDYEVGHGTFRGARSAGIRRFRDFPAAARRMLPDLPDAPIVMFCTGGIRCEKAGPYLQQIGAEKVHQLDGGILKYFERCGPAHFEGTCFVFDERVGLDGGLRPTTENINHHSLPLIGHSFGAALYH